MKTFKDRTGHSWTVEVTVTAIKRVRSLCDVDLLEVLDGKELITRLMSDPMLLADVIYALCKPQADALDISDETFGERLAGDAIDEATTALLEEVVNFSPNRRDRDAAAKVMQRTWETMDRARDLVEQQLEQQMEKMSAEALGNLKRDLQNDPQDARNGSSSPVPASSASTQEG